MRLVSVIYLGSTSCLLSAALPQMAIVWSPTSVVFPTATTAPDPARLASNLSSFRDTCQFWGIPIRDHRLLCGNCTDPQGQTRQSVIDLDQCIAYDNGTLIARPGGTFLTNRHKSTGCTTCAIGEHVGDRSVTMRCSCTSDSIHMDDPWPRIWLPSIVSNVAGILHCPGSVSWETPCPR